MQFLHKLIVIFFSLAASGLYGEIIYETGRLLEFIGGESADLTYDNYISHVSEGVAEPGYNDYGPDWLDTQTNGFGDYRIIPANSPTLDYWRLIFNNILTEDYQSVNSLLMDSLDSFHYELVQFTDTTFDHVYYMLREQLDSSFVDSNLSGIVDDDVIGSFRNGWGLYILNPAAIQSNLILEVPHPCDDFIAPYIATELFQQCDAFALLIAGAGREVKWTGVGDYNNGKSISDPSRNANTVFQVFHEVLSDSLMRSGPHSPLVLHTHSFDNSHEGFNSIVLSAGVHQPYANKPIRDITDDHLDFVNFTAEIPVAENTFGMHPPVSITDYYQVHYSGDFYYYGQQNIYEIPHSYELLGPWNGVQMVYLQQFYYSRDVYEPWVQIELDEKPELFDQMAMPVENLYSGSYPTSYHNFSLLLQYYQPFIDAVKAYMSNWISVPDTTSPADIAPFYPSELGLDFIRLHWNPVDDTNFKTYRIFITVDSSDSVIAHWDRSDYDGMADMRRSDVTVTGLAPETEYYFNIQAEDHFDNLNNLSTQAYNYIPGHSPPVVIVDFDSGNINLSSYHDQDNQPDAWSLDTTVTADNSQYSLKLTGDTWKVLSISPLELDSTTTWLAAAFIEEVSEIQGIGLMDSINTLFYSFAGTQEVNPDEWIPVYQGFFAEDQWATYHLPVGSDWVAYFDYLPNITTLVFINDQDAGSPGIVYFDNIIDVTPDLSIAPQVSINFTIGGIYRNELRQRSVDISFTAMIDDPDSYLHDYYWSFGDGAFSTENNPTHTYQIEDDHAYTVLLEISDETRLWGRSRTTVDVDPGPSTYPVMINFVGDIMLARDYEDDDGIIPTLGVESIFAPTRSVLGEAADITIANLECPLTDQGTAHPTKSVVFRGWPANVAGLSYAGIDVVSLANNHTLDFGLEGLMQTQTVLTENNIRHSGAGVNSYAADQPLFCTPAGVNIAFLASSDRTGQYNNAQPYLNAGLNKSGFAYMTPYNMLQQIEAVRSVADLIVFELHAGSEYSLAPGSNYDVSEFPGAVDGLENFSRTSGFGIIDVNDTALKAEDYSPRINVPHLWDRAIRHFALDNGADLVIVHHPHKIQGLEVHNGKLIAHSLGNFVFDLDYPETYPSMILNAAIDHNGFSAYTITPIYIDDYIPVPARAELGLYILDYLAYRSKELGTYLFVDRANIQGVVHLDTLEMERNDISCRIPAELFENNGMMVSTPLRLPRNGSIALLGAIIPTANWEYRLGREKIWFGNFEAEGSTEWDLDESTESLTDSIVYNDRLALLHQLSFDNAGTSITKLEDRHPIEADSTFSLHGFIRCENSQNAEIQIAYYSTRYSSFTLDVENAGEPVTGNIEWYRQSNELNIPGNANFFNIRLKSSAPDTGTSRNWFDDVGLIEWSPWGSWNISESILNPNDYYYIQIRTSQIVDTALITFNETIYGPLSTVIPEFTSNLRTGKYPLTVVFHDESSGNTGWWQWDFGDGDHGISQNPIHNYHNPGVYPVRLTVHDSNGLPITVAKTNYIIVTTRDPSTPGDINNDNIINQLDIIICIQLIFQLIEPSPEQFLAADVNNDLKINLLDLLIIGDRLLGD